MKNHEWVDGKLLQTDKKYSHLKQQQKERIYQWMYDAYKAAYKRSGNYPDDKEDDRIVSAVMDRIEDAEIWIPTGEVKKHFRSIKRNLHKRLAKELRQDPEYKIHIQPLNVRLSVCKVNGYSGIELTRPFCFIGTTDEENSLVCPEETVPENTVDRDDGWRGFRIIGQLDFSLIGILARISKILAANEIGIFAISTYNTDYVLTKEENFRKALDVLKGAGYEIEE